MVARLVKYILFISYQHYPFDWRACLCILERDERRRLWQFRLLLHAIQVVQFRGCVTSFSRLVFFHLPSSGFGTHKAPERGNRWEVKARFISRDMCNNKITMYKKFEFEGLVLYSPRRWYWNYLVRKYPCLNWRTFWTPLLATGITSSAIYV